MQKKLTITLDESVYEGLQTVIGRGRISQFMVGFTEPEKSAPNERSIRQVKRSSCFLLNEFFQDGPEQAVTLLKAFRSKYHALVTDIRLLGRLDGWRVARAAREVDPAFPVVYITGTASVEWPVQGVPNSVLLTKPFPPAQLVTTLSQLIGASPPPAGSPQTRRKASRSPATDPSCG